MRNPEQSEDNWVKYDQFRLNSDTFIDKRVKSMTWLSSKKKSEKCEKTLNHIEFSPKHIPLCNTKFGHFFKEIICSDIILWNNFWTSPI